MTSQRIIRSTQFKNSGHRVLLDNIQNISDKHADQQVELQKNQLQELFAEELESIRQECRTAAELEGYAAGEKLALEQYTKRDDDNKVKVQNFEKELKKSTDFLLSAAENILKSRNEYLQKYEAVLVEIVFSATLKIIGETLNDGMCLQRLVSAALDNACTDIPVKIRISKEDMQCIGDLSLIKQTDPRLKNVEFYVDEKLSRGDCHLESPTGSLDASLDAQLKAFRDLLLLTYDSTTHETECE